MVKIYWNLHRKCWSVLHRGKILRYASTIVCRGAEFRVSEPGRQRVLREGRKNVHAFVVSSHVSFDSKLPEYLKESQRIRYNPYTGPAFIWRSLPLKSTAGIVYLDAQGRVYGQ